MIVNIEVGRLDRRVKTAWRDTTQIMGSEFTKAITDPIYNWPRGENPRDIVDTGRLRSSQRVDRISDFTTNYSWPVEYALAVHNGARLRNGTFLPARPWTRIAFSRRNPTTVFNRLMAV
jgi:hypothetical protein